MPAHRLPSACALRALLPVALVALVVLPGCRAQGEWVPTLWGGPVLDDARAPESAGRFVSEDGCDVTINAFVVSVRTGALLTSEGTASAVFSGEQLFDLAQPGPHSAASVVLRRGAYPETVWIVGATREPGPSVLVGKGALTGWDNAASDSNPALGNATAAQRDAMVAAGANALLDGSLLCGDNPDDAITASLLIDDADALLRCAHGDFEVPGGSFGATRVEVRGESLLGESPGRLRLADADDDGIVTMAELDDAEGDANADAFVNADDRAVLGGLDPAVAGDHVRLGLRRAWRSESEPCAWEALPTE